MAPVNGARQIRGKARGYQILNIQQKRATGRVVMFRMLFVLFWSTVANELGLGNTFWVELVEAWSVRNNAIFAETEKAQKKSHY